MKRVIKHPKKMKNAMYIVFGAFALALFAITRIHPSYANDGLMIDDALDAIVLYGEVEQLPEDEEVEEVQNEEIQEIEEEEDIVEPEENSGENVNKEDEASENLDETVLERDNKGIDGLEIEGNEEKVEDNSEDMGKKVEKGVETSDFDKINDKLGVMDTDTFTVSFDVDGGTPRDSITVIGGSKLVENVKKYSSTSNIGYDGTKIWDYATGLAYRESINIPGATKLHVTLTYGTEESWDYLYIFSGEWYGSVSRGMSQGQLYTYNGNQNNPTTVDFYIDGDTVTFAFYSDSSQNGYGYYAVIESVTGMPNNPTKEGKRFDGWYKSDGEKWSFTGDIVDGNLTLYAHWIEPEAIFLPGSNFNKKIKGLAKGLAIKDYYDTDTLITNIEKYEGTQIPEGAIKIEDITSDYDIYAWFSEGTIYYKTEATKIYFNEDSSHMFQNLNGLHEFNFKVFDLSRVSNMYQIFYGPGLKKVDLSDMDLHSVTNVEYMFQNNSIIEEVDFSNINMSGLESRSEGPFRYISSLKKVNLSGANFSSLKTMSYLFGYCYNLEEVNLSNANFGSSTSMFYMFVSNNQLRKVDFSNANLGNVTDVSGLFSNCSNLRDVDFSYANLSKAKPSWTDSFIPSYIRTISFEGTNLSSVESMQYWFQSKNILNEVNFSGTKLDNLENMSYMFQSNNGLTGVDFSHTNLNSVKTMENMFNGASLLESVNFGENTLSNVTTMRDMFLSCYNLKEVDVSNWNTSNVKNMNDMFYNCYNLKELKVNNWDTSNVERMSDIFNGCKSLEVLDVSNWNTSKLTSMGGIFNGCSGLVELDLSSWDSSGVTYMSNMFKDATNLKTIYVSDKFVTNNVTSSGSMFTGAISLVGGNGTAYSGNKVDGEYARIDTDATPGYFTNILDREYTITYYTNGGVLSGEKTIYTQRVSFTLPIPIKTGYTFLGWTGSNGLEPEITVNIAEFTVGDLEYTANWGIGKYKIIFDTDGGNEINPIEKDYNSLLTGITLPRPTKECNEFSGWDIELPERMPAHDITLKAIWEYTCSRSSGGGGGAKKSESTTREIAIDTSTDQEHNSANEEQKSETSETSNTPTNGETTHQVISVTQEISEDGTPIEVVVETVKIKNTDIVATVRTEVSSASSSSSSSSSTTHTKEQNDAYSFAKSNGITTTSSIEDAKMNTELTRIQMAKMLSNFAINVLGQEPDPEKGIVKFNDVTNKMDKQYDNAVTKAYQLGIMGQNMKNNEFRPSDTVTRAEFASALSRLLYQTEEGEYKGTGKYYIPHVSKLYNEGIINKTDPEIKEKRGYVMTMLMRTVE